SMDRAPDLDNLQDGEIIERYRFDRNGIDFLVALLGQSIQPKAKVLIILRYLATGPIQLNDADIHGVSQPTVSRVLSQVIAALSSPELIRRNIRLPRRIEECRRNAEHIRGIARFPYVIGAIDGTHINIVAPHVQEEIYYNLIDAVARWPGSVHGSRVLRESSLNNLFLGYMPRGFHLLGTSGYPAKRSNKVTRALVERGIGQLKKRFGILHREIIHKPVKVC
ncbi:HARB1-like protein, partial [Mya arenaria]